LQPQGYTIEPKLWANELLTALPFTAALFYTMASITYQLETRQAFYGRERLFFMNLSAIYAEPAPYSCYNQE